MRRITALLISFVFFLSCNKENNVSNPDLNIPNQDPPSKEEVLEAIANFSHTISTLSSGTENLNYSAGIHKKDSSYTPPAQEVVKYSKDYLVESHWNSGVDLEWLDMSKIVLEFSEALTNSQYNLGEETKFYDVLDNPSLWGWEVYDNTKVILKYEEETLYLRVINDKLVQTFFFSYNEDNFIEILRLYEEINPEGVNSLYIEDFIEKSGITFWSSLGGYESYSRVKSANDGLFTFRIDNYGNNTFSSANYTQNNVPIMITQDYKVYYDLKFVETFDSFTTTGKLYKNEELVSIPLQINVHKSFDNDSLMVMTGVKHLSSFDNSLTVNEANIKSNITYESINSDIDSLLSLDLKPSGYDYSKDIEVILEDYSDLLYLEY